MHNNIIKVLDLRDSPWFDGPGRTILQCAEDIDSYKAIRIFIGAFNSGLNSGTEYEKMARIMGLSVYQIKETRQFDIKPLKQIIAIIKSQSIDILHTHDFRSNLMGMVAAHLLNKPLIVTVHGWIANDLKGKIKTRIDKLIAKRSNHIISVSKKTVESLGNPTSLQNYTVIPNALRIDDYNHLRPYGKLRSEYGIKENEIVVATVGRLSPEKGQDLFIRAAQVIIKENRNARFLIIGTGPDRPLLEKLVEEIGLEKNVVFTGYRDDMQYAYKDIDLIVQSSWTEGMPNVILEAMLMQVPVIATDVGGTGEIVSHGSSGILIGPGDLSALTSKILHFVNHPEDFTEMAANGRKQIVDNFNHEKRVKMLQDIYSNVLNKFRRGQHHN